ncbi:hypothetical protein ELE36_14170 [Pseudolysobacter antarcticus]|uniref:Uncharacterized protein n=1 Tax=Pseudolysobacter antarcticus TaxID=2511995 RepID=A0A411HM12_9GAMM|nr:hypothetical protein [Pseudolysobacter antarcticus]QBB71407.1 hypothetical protein ELE36_14170 [Pseudolysobacter antarcticus]
MNAKTNLIWVCNHALKLLSAAALAIVVAGLLGFAAQSKSLAALNTGQSQTAPPYALEWQLGDRRLRYFETSKTGAAEWSFDAFACRHDDVSTLAPGRWRVIAQPHAAGRDAQVSLAPLDAGDANALPHPRALIACGERGTPDAVAIPAHTLSWLAARSGGVVYVRQ